MRILSDPLNELTEEDINQLCSDQVSEGTEIEFKADLPTRDGKTPDAWHVGGHFGEYARNAIAQEIVALANTLGGAIIIGIQESGDQPSRAAGIDPLPRVHDLARQLRQSIYDRIDPPLPLLESQGVECGTAGSGVVIIRVAASRRKPHRLQSNREVYIRRSDESVRIGMRQIQELTIQALSETKRAEDVISSRRKVFTQQYTAWVHSPEDGMTKGGGALHLLGVPVGQFDLGKVVHRPELTAFTSTRTTATVQGQSFECYSPLESTLRWRPSLRSLIANQMSTDRRHDCLLRTDGVCELSFSYRQSEGFKGFFIEWLVGMLGQFLGWLAAIRSAAEDVQVEFALAPQLLISGQDAALGVYGARHWTSFNNGCTHHSLKL
jgi:hypothetical protein